MPAIPYTAGFSLQRLFAECGTAATLWATLKRAALLVLKVLLQVLLQVLLELQVLLQVRLQVLLQVLLQV